MEAQTIFYPPSLLLSFFLSLSLFLLSISLPSPCFDLYFAGCSIFLVSCFFLALPFSSPSVSSVFPVADSFWLTSFLVSFLPFSVSSLEKLCALRGEHPFYTNRAERERMCVRRECVSMRSFFFFLVSHSYIRIVVYVYVCLFTYVWASCSPRTVIEDFGREWECHVDEWN